MIWVPIAAISITGSAINPVKKMYMKRSPSVISPESTDAPPTRIITTPIAPTITDEKAVTAETPIIDRRMLRKSLCAPRAKISSSRFSAV